MIFYKDVDDWVQALKRRACHRFGLGNGHTDSLTDLLQRFDGVCDYLIGSPLLASRVRK